MVPMVYGLTTALVCVSITLHLPIIKNPLTGDKCFTLHDRMGETSIEDKSHNVAIETRDGTFLCDGSLIKPNVVLTPPTCNCHNNDLLRVRTNDGQVLDATVDSSTFRKDSSDAHNVLNLKGSFTLNDQVKTIDPLVLIIKERVALAQLGLSSA